MHLTSLIRIRRETRFFFALVLLQRGILVLTRAARWITCVGLYFSKMALVSDMSLRSPSLLDRKMYSSLALACNTQLSDWRPAIRREEVMPVNERRLLWLFGEGSSEDKNKRGGQQPSPIRQVQSNT